MIKKECITESKLRINNLNQYIKDKYKGKKSRFYSAYRSRLEASRKGGDVGKVKQLQEAMGTGKRTFTISLQNSVESMFDLPKGILTKSRLVRFPAYVFVSCTGDTAYRLYEELQKNRIVDEISVLFGDIDILIRVYGTHEEIQKLVTTDLYTLENININHSRTYFSLEGKNWTRYSISKHPSYTPPQDRWE